MVNYVIYEIICKDPGVTSCYVGRSTNFKNRISYHQNPQINKPKSELYNYPLYKCVRDNKGWNNWIIQPIEILKNSNLDEASEREQYWIETKHANLNQINAIEKDKNKRKNTQIKYLKRKDEKLSQLIEEICNKYKSINPDKNIDINEVIAFVKNDIN